MRWHGVEDTLLVGAQIQETELSSLLFNRPLVRVWAACAGWLGNGVSK